MEVLQIPLKLAKENLLDIINEINEDDILTFTTKWIKEKGEERLMKSMFIKIEKGIHPKVRK
jgi:hypothetical protein